MIERNMNAPSVLLLICALAVPLESTFASSSFAGRLDQIGPGTWAAISKNTVADVNPKNDPALNPERLQRVPWRGSTGQASVIDAWNGGVFVPSLGAAGALVLFGGGHGNYFGNELYAFDIAKSKWSRLTDPFIATHEVLTAEYPLAEFPDGSPLPPHTYDYVEYDPSTDSIVVLKGLQRLNVSGNPYSSGPPHIFDVGIRKWIRGRGHGYPVLSGGYSAYDSRRKVIWTESPGRQTAGLRSFDPSKSNPDGTRGSWSVEFGRTGIVADSVAAYDPQRDLLVFTRFRKGADEIYAIDLKNPDAGALRLRQAGSAPAPEPAHGWEWSARRQSFLYWRRGGDVYEFKPPTGNWQQAEWRWSLLTSGANSTAPGPMKRDNGVYGRFRVVEFAGMEFAIVVNSVIQPVFAFRVP